MSGLYSDSIFYSKNIKYKEEWGEDLQYAFALQLGFHWKVTGEENWDS